MSWSASVPAVPKLWFRSAKPSDVDWFKGEWNRLILPSVARDFPELLPIYREQALAALNRALNQGGRNARVLPATPLGLLQIEMGDDEGRPSVHLGERRDRRCGTDRMVLTELARLRLARYLRGKHESDQKLTEFEGRAKYLCC